MSYQDLGVMIESGALRTKQEFARAGNQLGAGPKSPSGDLDRIRQQAESVIGSISSATATLRAHAARLYGEEETAQGGEAGRPTSSRAGAFGALEDLLDQLERECGELHSAVQRNCRLA